MTAIRDLSTLLANLAPQKLEGEWVFCSLSSASAEQEHTLLQDCLASFREPEGLSLLLPRRVALANALPHDGVFHGITLRVHSSLHAVGLTAAVADCLTQEGISANVIAASCHDHVFVPVADSERALAALESLARANGEIPA